MKLLTAERHYALNDRTINLLLKGNIDMTASTSMKDGGNEAKGSDEDIVDLLDIENEVEFHKARSALALGGWVGHPL